MCHGHAMSTEHLDSTRGREITEQEMTGKIIRRTRHHAAVGDRIPNILSKLKSDDSINKVHEKDADVSAQ